MNRDSRQFLEALLTTPSVSGYEEGIQRLVARRMRNHVDSIETDLHGNVICALNPDAPLRVMLSGHCDQIGFMVRHIAEDGFIYVAPIGGVDLGVCLGARMRIHSATGSVLAVCGRKPIHLQTAEERDKLKLDADKLWLDIGARSRREAESKVAIGDSVTFELGSQMLGDDLITAPGLDDKVGLFIALQVMLRCRAKGLKVALFSTSSVQEEMGLRGATTAAYRVDPHVAIAIDVTHASDNPGQENRKVPPVRLGAGPTISKGPNSSPPLVEQLVKAAKRAKVPFQPLPLAVLAGNEARAFQVNRRGAATVTLGIPNRYMHTQAEVVSLGDIEAAIKLLTNFVQGISSRTRFEPVRL